MSYLEERGIVHRDLAARNVLGTSNLVHLNQVLFNFLLFCTQVVNNSRCFCVVLMVHDSDQLISLVIANIYGCFFKCADFMENLQIIIIIIITRGQSNLTKSASRGPIPWLGVTPGGRKLYH